MTEIVAEAGVPCDSEPSCMENALVAAKPCLDGSTDLHRPPPLEHLIGLPGGSWTVWRLAALRSAGFPVSDVLCLAFPRCAAAADELLEREAAVEAAKVVALAKIQEAFDAGIAQDGFEVTRLLSKARRDLAAGRVPHSVGLAEVDAAGHTFRSASAEAAAARQGFDRLFIAARDETSMAVRRTAGTSLFREAVIWQNHPVLQTCIAPLLRNSAATPSSKNRQHEELVASYLHRYCTKNETIGFFGPVGWARFADQGQALDVKTGPNLLRSRQVYFEQWAIDLLAKQLSAEETLKSWIAVRPTPVAQVRGLAVRLPFRPPLALTKEEMAVFVACNGVLTTHQLTEQLCEVGSKPQLTREQLKAILNRLEGQRLISVDYILPLDAHPEVRLRELLAGIGDSSLRMWAAAAVAQLEADRDAVAAAAGDPDKLHSALIELDSDFTALTGSSPNRSPGQMYTGRTLVYEDTQRDVTVHIGPPILASLGPPLTLVLLSARWLTYQVGLRFREILSELFERLVRTYGLDSVGFVEFYNCALARMAKETAFAEAAEELQKRWRKILSPPEAAKSVRYEVGRLRDRVSKAFAAPSPGWPGACYHSPDLMIAGPSLAAINSGNCHFVLGELHLGANTLRGRFLVEQHPHPDEIFRGIEADQPGVRLVPITPKRYAQRATRIFPVLTSAGQHFVAMTLDSVPPPGLVSVPARLLKVRKSAAGLVVENRDSALQFDLFQSFAGVLTRIVVDAFAIMLPSGHTPRVSFDSLTVAREAWRFNRSEIGFADKANSPDRFLAARRWRDTHGMPRWVFVKVPGEIKPIYVDFDSPCAVNIVSRTIRNHKPSRFDARHFTVTEMLPCHGEHWLTDARGRTYSCELRIVTVDQVTAARSP